MVWLSEPPTAAYWDQAAGLPETTITVASSPGPHGVWVTILSSAQRRDKYQVKCKHHACPGPRNLTDTYVHVHGRDKVRPEVQDAMRELLAELYASKRPGDRCPNSGDGPVRLHAMPVEMGPRTILKPNLTPGVHFHHVTALVSILGILLGWDAGNPSMAERQEAREEDDIEDPEGMAAAIVQEAGGEVVSRTILRGPATAQEGEALSMNVAIRSVQEATGLPPASDTTAVWGIADSQSAAVATEAYAEDPKAKDMMARVAHKVHEGKPIVMTKP